MGKSDSVLEIPLEISDVSGQKVFSVTNAPASNTVGELVHEMLGKMNLPRNDASGAPLDLPGAARSGRAVTSMHPSASATRWSAATSSRSSPTSMRERNFNRTHEDTVWL